MSLHPQPSIPPVLDDSSWTGWPSRTKGAFEATDFTVDWERRRVRCSENHTSTRGREYCDKATDPYIRARFSGADCNTCPSKPRCTRGRDQGRRLTLPARVLQSIATAAAINFDRLAAWFAQRPLAPTRVSPSAALAA